MAKQVTSKKEKIIWWPWAVLAGFAVLGILASLVPQERVLTEEEINANFAEAVLENQKVNHFNPTESLIIDLSNDEGLLTITWEEGQELIATIEVSEAGDEFIVTNVDIPNAGFLENFLETTGQKVIDSVLEEFVKAIPRDVQRIEINDGEVEFIFDEE